ncbi:hypothetical protein [Micromonospora sp. NPDC005305]|uniref:GTPase domain-containing protein n=1 Tax=Micromonospora sp. NPDC005305 TaxID=3156875 RepID=UPI0033B1BAA7
MLLLVLLVVLALAGYVLAGVTVAPLALCALLAGCLAGLVTGLAEATFVLAGLAGVPRVRTPRDEFTGARRGRSGAYRQDYAWIHYAHRQAGYDLRHVSERCRDRLAGLWSRGWRALPRLPRYHLRFVDPHVGPDSPYAARSRTWTVLIGWPLLVLPVAGLAGLTVGVVAALVLLGAVVVTVAALAWLFAVVWTGVLRLADDWGRTRRGTALCCPHCYFLVELPEYRCPGEHGADAPAGADRHRMLRPGLRGLWRRRCGCGCVLPVRLASAGGQLAASCPKCGARLAAGSGRSSEVRVALFGAVGAGKSTLVESLVTGLVALFPPERCSISRRGRGRDPLRPEVVTVTVLTHGANQRLQIFDAPGRGLLDPVVCRSYAYLHETRHFLFVLDPPAGGGARGDAADAGTPAEVRLASEPLEAYEAVVVGLRYRGVDTGRCRLAVVVSKADGFRSLPAGGVPGPAPDEVRRWLEALGLDHLVTAAVRDFAQVGFFLAGRDVPAAVEPLRWLLRAEPAVRGEVARALR